MSYPANKQKSPLQEALLCVAVWHERDLGSQTRNSIDKGKQPASMTTQQQRAMWK